MKKINIIYWIFTGLAGAMMLASAVPDILLTPDTVRYMSEYLHYPNYFTVFIGVAKTLGVIAILIPGFPRLKEWGYAGLFFDLIGAVYSQIAVGIPAWGPEGGWLLMLIWFIPLIVSYIYYHKKRKAVKAPQE